MHASSSFGETLRPLGLGELLDRAVTLCVRHFVLFSLIYVVYAIPSAVVQYFATKDVSQAFQMLADVLLGRASGGKPDTDRILKTFSQLQTPNAWTMLSGAIAFFIGPLPAGALIVATSATYLGRTTSFREAYRAALDRWLPLVGVNVLYLLAVLGLYLVTVMVLLVLVFGLTFLTVQLRALGVALDIVLGLTLLVGVFALGIVIALAILVSYFTCVVECASFATAFARGIGRVFGGVGLRRSLLVGLAFASVGLGIFILGAVGQSLIYGFLRSSAAGAVYTTVLGIATAAFTTAFVGIFYFDLRVREEGLDLELAAQGTAVAPT